MSAEVLQMSELSNPTLEGTQVTTSKWLLLDKKCFCRYNICSAVLLVQQTSL